MTEINTREIAETLILDRARDVNALAIANRLLNKYGNALSVKDADRYGEEISDLIAKANITVELPAETAP